MSTEEKINDLGGLVGKYKLEEALALLGEISTDLNSPSLQDEVTRIQVNYTVYQEQSLKGLASADTIRVSRNIVIDSLLDAKTLAANILTNGEPAPAAATTTTSTPAKNKVTMIDMAIVVLIGLVFLVLLVAFAVGLFTDPIKLGLVAFASAIMIGIILFLLKYKRDLGTSAMQPLRRASSN